MRRSYAILNNRDDAALFYKYAGKETFPSVTFLDEISPSPKPSDNSLSVDVRFDPFDFAPTTKALVGTAASPVRRDKPRSRRT